MQIFLLFFAISYCEISANAIHDPCQIRACPNLKFNYINGNSSSVQNETLIGLQGHWRGVRAESYSLYFDFRNRTHYIHASAYVTVKILRSISHILINQDFDKLIIDYRLITIRSQCDARKLASENCIEKFLFATLDQTLILVLKQGLEVNCTHILSFPNFYQHPNASAERQSGSLRDWVNIKTNSAALTTIFHPRKARSVFPCFDHPGLKARFDVCIDHPSHLLAASNAMIDPDRSMDINRTKRRDCFHQTPIMSTYLFAIALLENYTVQRLEMPNQNLTLELYASNQDTLDYGWILEASVPALNYMSNMTNFKFPMRRLGFLITEHEEYSYEHWGLISFDRRALIGDATYFNKTILHHEIVHQWMGDLITVSDWKQQCLQEGSTSYFEWKISSENGGPTMDDRAVNDLSAGRIPLLADGDYPAFISKDQSYETSYECYRRPAFFFHAIAQFGGFGIMERLLARLIQKRAFGVYDIDLWEQTLTEVEPRLNGYIKGWFASPGILFLIISEISPTQILIQQRFHTNGTFVETSRPVPIFYYAFTESRTHKNRILLTSTNESLHIGLRNVYLFDPDGHTLSVKIYPISEYIRILRNEHLITMRRMQNMMQEFCIAFMRDIFPIEENANTNEWKEFFGLMETRNLTDPNCACCVRQKMQGVNETCETAWNRTCPKLRIRRLIFNE